MTSSPTDSTERIDPIRLVCLVALVASHGLVRLAERYLPEFLSALGYGPIVVGSLVTLGMGVAVVASDRSDNVSNDMATTLETTATVVLSTALAAVGLFAWAGSPTLDTLLGTPLSALGWLATGVVLLQAWYVGGPGRHLWPIDTRATAQTSGLSSAPADESDGGDRSARRTATIDRRTRTVVGALGVAAAAVFATAAVASADTVGAGFALIAATGAAVALVGAVALGTVRDRSPLLGDRLRSGGGTNDERTNDGGANDASLDADSSLTAFRDAVSRVPDRRRWAVIGDALVRVATAGIAPFLILLVVEYRAIALSVGGLSLAPAAVFGLFVLTEAGGAVFGAIGAPALIDHLDRRALLAAGLAGISLLPMAIIAAPPQAGVVAGLFGLLGCRTAIEPLRPTVGTSTRASPVPGSRLPEEIRTAVRIAIVPAPLVGGILYAIDPLVAFTAATTVGLLGVRELGRAFTFGRHR
ncbi:transporter [Natrinema halophilum]|uniref:Transporter n=1 Tax=Natrinema halophilum TaxID=1699371 RepID=A0A7D5KZX8_9EURY|nr:transporter [Natrinema halophilum]QLG50360.1 transporter [Natrinema halophilum]